MKRTASPAQMSLLTMMEDPKPVQKKDRWFDVYWRLIPRGVSYQEDMLIQIARDEAALDGAQGEEVSFLTGRIASYRAELEQHV